MLVHVFEPPAYRLRAVAPRHAQFAKDVLLQLAFRRSLRRARAVTAGSQTTADWLRSHAGVDADVVLPGIDPAFLESEPAQPDEPPYVLHLASGDPRDNTDLVVRAFATGEASGLRLVLAGAPDRLRARLERSRPPTLEIVGWVSDERAARALPRRARVRAPDEVRGVRGPARARGDGARHAGRRARRPGSDRGGRGRRASSFRGRIPTCSRTAFARLRDDAALRADLAARGRALARGLTWESAAAGFAAAFRKALALPPRSRGT